MNNIFSSRSIKQALISWTWKTSPWNFSLKVITQHLFTFWKNYKNVSKRHQCPSEGKKPCNKYGEEGWIVVPGFKLIPQRQKMPGGKEAQWGVISEWGICKLVFVLFWWREHNKLQVCCKNQYLPPLPYVVNTLLQVWLFFFFLFEHLSWAGH